MEVSRISEVDCMKELATEHHVMQDFEDCEDYEKMFDELMVNADYVLFAGADLHETVLLEL